MTIKLEVRALAKIRRRLDLYIPMKEAQEEVKIVVKEYLVQVKYRTHAAEGTFRYFNGKLSPKTFLGYEVRIGNPAIYDLLLAKYMWMKGQLHYIQLQYF